MPTAMQVRTARCLYADSAAQTRGCRHSFSSEAHLKRKTLLRRDTLHDVNFTARRLIPISFPLENGIPRVFVLSFKPEGVASALDRGDELNRIIRNFADRRTVL